MKQVQAIIAAGILAATISAGGQPAAATAPAVDKYVVFVNVGEAVPKDVMAKAAPDACRQLSARFKTNTVAKLNPAELNGAREKTAKHLDADAALTVFLVNDESTYGFLSAPGSWALVNMRSLKQDNPSAETYNKRVTKMMMKGIAHAAGVGANTDVHCVLYYNSFSLSGIDATSESYGPHAYFPLMETLRQLGGEGVFVPMQ